MPGILLVHATVLLYHAGVKKGYSTFCPSCYVDCGKRTTTGPDETFLISCNDRIDSEARGNRSPKK